MKECVETIQNQTMGVIFNIQNSPVLTCSLPTGTRLKWVNCRFSFSAARNVIAKTIEYVTFGFPLRLLVFSLF